MHRTALLSFSRGLDDARTTFDFGDDYWTAAYPTLEDAISTAFVHDLLNSEEACDALATERHMIPWKKPVVVTTHFLKALGFEPRASIRITRRA